jgi:PKD repeat protein
VYFTDTSSNNPTNWLWDFGDGTTSSLQNPQHKYSTPGTYTVRLNASNDADYDIEEKGNYIIVKDRPGDGDGDDGGNGTGHGPFNGSGNNLIDAMKNFTASGDPLSNLQKGGGGNGKAYEIEVPQAQNDPLTPYILAVLLIIGLILIGYFYGIKNRR